MSGFLSVLRTQPTRVFGVVVAVIALVAAFGIAVPSTEVEGVVLALLALASGHTIQKSQDATVNAALYTYPPELAAVDHAADPVPVADPAAVLAADPAPPVGDVVDPNAVPEPLAG